MIYGWDSMWHDTFVRFIGQILDKKQNQNVYQSVGPGKWLTNTRWDLFIQVY